MHELGDLSQFESVDVAGSTGGTQAPARRRWGSVTWSDTSGNLWLFGGQGITTNNVSGASFGLLNAIWKWTPGPLDVSLPNQKYSGSYVEQGSWTAVANVGAANNAGTYGAVGAGGFPGGRWGAGFTPDAAGNVWMFGGQGFDSSGNLVLLNDLWKYNIAAQTWTWMGPTNSNTGQHNGVYGARWVRPERPTLPDQADDKPRWFGRTISAVFVFGGLGFDSIGTQNPGSLNGSLVAR
jgi:hypothetical protein